jgi:hypothetical protein
MVDDRLDDRHESPWDWPVLHRAHIIVHDTLVLHPENVLLRKQFLQQLIRVHWVSYTNSRCVSENGSHAKKHLPQLKSHK